MTISDLVIPTDSLANPRKFYPLEISVPHHQLRHFISLASNDRLYYVNHYDIFCLCLQTQKRILLATVPFEARCLAADHGWIAVGGELKGDCAFVRVDEENEEPKCFGHDLVVDVLGGEIVNAMTIHRLQNQSESENEPVVVISNNDKTVKIYSLAQREVLTTIKHAVPMNYATLSPDGEIIAAVGDSEEVFFYQRKVAEQLTGSTKAATVFPKYEWQRLACPPVPAGEHTPGDHCFSIAFSQTGRLCAASSRGGMITVFDMEELRSDPLQPTRAITSSFRSSRQGLWGCVRYMAFAPEPWDMLAWAEDHGRIGVADVRQCFLRRQIIELDQEKVEILAVEDATPIELQGLGLKEKLKQQHLRTLPSTRRTTTEGSRIEQLLAESRAEQRRQTRQELLAYHHGSGLDPRERSVLDALETTMDDVDEDLSAVAPYSVNYTALTRFRPSVSASEARREVDVQVLHPSHRLVGPRAQPPRRRSSVVLSEPQSNQSLAPPDSVRALMTASPGPMTETEDDLLTTSNIDYTQRRVISSLRPLSSNIPPSDPWYVIQSALETARRDEPYTASRHGLPDPASATLSQVEAELEAERLLGDQLERQLSDERQLSALLRRQVGSQERILQSQEQELSTQERESGVRLEPAVERLLQRQLENEQRFGEQRSEELTTEIAIGSRRIQRLESERVALLRSLQPNPSTTSGQTSALETSRTDSSTESLQTTIHRHEEFRRQRLTHAASLEQQTRRAVSRASLASSDIQALESAVHRNANDRHARLAEARAGYRARAAENAANRVALSNAETVASVRAQAALRRAGVAVNADHTFERNAVRSSGLSSRPSENSIRLARQMFSSSARAAMDANGNWESAAALRMILGRTIPGMADGSLTLDEVINAMGVGTAGLAWSPDGTTL